MTSDIFRDDTPELQRKWNGMETTTGQGGRDLRVLSLDGGGVRGLSSLYILRALMNRVNSLRLSHGQVVIKPCQLFDLIAGTSTGGLIAIMLGRLHMDVDECIEVYRTMCSKVFDSPKSVVSRGFHYVTKNSVEAKFSAKCLEEQVIQVIRRRYGDTVDPTTPLKEAQSEQVCKVFVCATSRTTTNETIRLRSYMSDQLGVPENTTIVQAALATSAATGFFDPVEIEGDTFVDGALVANNPIAEAFEEVRGFLDESDCMQIESQIGCLVSIGTGNPGLNPLSDSAWEMIRKSLIGIITETERTAERFYRSHNRLFQSGHAFRFNVINGLQDVGLDEWNRSNEIKSKTDAYLRLGQLDNDFKQCTRQLTNQVSTINTLEFRFRKFLYGLRDNWMGIALGLAMVLCVWFSQHWTYQSFIKQNAPFFKQQSVLNSNYPIYAILGVTGVGKSSFIATVGGRHVTTGALPSIGYSLQSHTAESNFYFFESFQTGQGYLIDTPGIDESNQTRTDTEIMQQISNELNKVQVRDKMLMGLIFLYDIRQPRAYGSILNALNSTIDMVEYLLGTNGIAKISLVTTKWTKGAAETTRNAEEDRERMLREEFWQGPLSCGSLVERYDGTKQSALNIISSLKERRRPMYTGSHRCRTFKSPQTVQSPLATLYDGSAANAWSWFWFLLKWFPLSIFGWYLATTTPYVKPWFAYPMILFGVYCVSELANCNAPDLLTMYGRHVPRIWFVLKWAVPLAEVVFNVTRRFGPDEAGLQLLISVMLYLCSFVCMAWDCS